MFCTHCGARNKEGLKFCTTCGAALIKQPNVHAENGALGSPSVPGAVTQDPLPSATREAPSEFGASSKSVPSQKQTVPSAVSLESSAAKKGSWHPRRWAVVLAAALSVALVAAGTLVVTYNREMWGGVSLPDARSFASQSKHGADVKADTIVKQLREKGVTVHTEKVFSGHDSGAFLGYDHASAGERVRKGTTVTVKESAGPGVPSGTVGKKAATVRSSLAGMNVPVHYKSVVVDDSAKYPSGTVVQTYPSEGGALPASQKKDGIYVGVASKGSGVGADIISMDQSQAQSTVEAAGFDVVMRPQVSSKENVGKIVDSSPSPGSVVDEGETVALYYGVDASGFKDSLKETQDGSTFVTGSTAAAAGTYCTKAGTCLTLVGNYDDYTESTQQSLTKSDEVSDDVTTEVGSHLLVCDAIQQVACSDSSSFLVNGDSGAVDLIPYRALTGYQCNGKDVTGSVQLACSTSSDNGVHSTTMHGAKYVMDDYYVLFPVGSDVSTVEKSGVFAASALATAKKKTAVDVSRPFIMVRDKSLYATKDRSVDLTNLAQENPFIPLHTSHGETGAVAEVPFKPAPSDDTAYYLVEGSPTDWQNLPDANDSASDNGSGTTASGQAEEKSYTPDEITTAVRGGDFTPIVGKYCRKDDSGCVTIDKIGGLTSTGSTPYLTYADHHKGKVAIAGDDVGWDVDSSVGIELRGPDSDYHCGDESGYEACNGAKSYSASETFFPIDVIYVFKGVDPAATEDLAAAIPEDDYVAPDTSRPFLMFPTYSMNESPTDSSVFYLQE